MNTDELKQLLSRIELHNKMEEVPYSILPMMYNRISSKELLHSEIIASLLDPNEKHGLGEVPLQCFLDKIDCNDFGELSKTIVELEKGVEDMRRIDILLTNGNKAIIIENKLNDAVDLPNQLKDYLRSITNKELDVLKIVYLPLYEYKSAKEKVDNVLNLYPKDLIDWLSSCNSDTCNDYNLLLKYMNQTNINFMEAKALQSKLSPEELTKLIEVANIVNSNSWKSARLKTLAEQITVPGVIYVDKAGHMELYLENYKYWVEIWVNDFEYRLWVVANNKDLEVDGFVYDQFSKYYYYKNIAKFSYKYPCGSDNIKLIADVTELLRISKS